MTESHQERLTPEQYTYMPLARVVLDLLKNNRLVSVSEMYEALKDVRNELTSKAALRSRVNFMVQQGKIKKHEKGYKIYYSL